MSLQCDNILTIELLLAKQKQDAANAAANFTLAAAHMLAGAMEHEAEEVEHDVEEAAKKALGWVEDVGSDSC